MILLDTHVWLWWLTDTPKLTDKLISALQAFEPDGLAVSAISCWEIAYKAAAGKLELGKAPREWIDAALTAPGIQLVPITAQIATEAALLPGEFHRDPADRIIVATARLLDCPILTIDRKITAYTHVKHA